MKKERDSLLNIYREFVVFGGLYNENPFNAKHLALCRVIRVDQVEIASSWVSLKNTVDNKKRTSKRMGKFSLPKSGMYRRQSISFIGNNFNKKKITVHAHVTKGIHNSLHI